MPKRLGNIYASIYDIENLKIAHKKARKDKSFYRAVKATDENLDERLRLIQEQLQNHTYKVGLYKTSRYQDRGKERILFKLPYFPDRIIQWAIMNQIEITFRTTFLPTVCASLPGRGIHYASNILRDYLVKNPEETKYCLKLDIRKFYPSINREILKKLLRKKFKDKDLLYELDNIIDSAVHTDIEKLNLTQEEKDIYCRPGKGIPVGSYLSQYLANFYLSEFDHWIKEECKCHFYLRYMDDIVILSNSKEFLHNVLCAIKIYLKEILDLEVKGNYAVFPVDVRGIDFVGYRHFRGYNLLRKSTAKHFKRIALHAQKHEYITHERQWCAVISAQGWLIPANTYNFAKKYFYPLTGLLGTYYRQNKMSAKINNIFKAYFFAFEKYKEAHKKVSYNPLENKIAHKQLHGKGGTIIYDKKTQCKMWYWK